LAWEHFLCAFAVVPGFLTALPPTIPEESVHIQLRVACEQVQNGALKNIAGRKRNEITKFTVNTARPKVGPNRHIHYKEWWISKDEVLNTTLKCRKNFTTTEIKYMVLCFIYSINESYKYVFFV
jgi:hypothetical protein